MDSKYEEMEEDEFRRSKGATEIEALREWKKIPEHIRKLLLANAFCHNCGTTEFAPGYTLRMRHSCVLIEGRCAKCGAEVARLCDQPSTESYWGWATAGRVGPPGTEAPPTARPIPPT